MVKKVLRNIYIRKCYIQRCLKNKDIAIISNNCIGADICHNLGLRFNSPTVNLQILPSDFVKFCSKLDYYLSVEVKECDVFSACQRELIMKEYGRNVEELNFPFGICDDILIAFQHYNTFCEAKEAGKGVKKELIG